MCSGVLGASGLMKPILSHPSWLQGLRLATFESTDKEGNVNTILRYGPAFPLGVIVPTSLSTCIGVVYSYTPRSGPLVPCLSPWAGSMGVS